MWDELCLLVISCLRTNTISNSHQSPCLSWPSCWTFLATPLTNQPLFSYLPSFLQLLFTASLNFAPSCFLHTCTVSKIFSSPPNLFTLRSLSLKKKEHPLNTSQKTNLIPERTTPLLISFQPASPIPERATFWHSFFHPANQFHSQHLYSPTPCTFLHRERKGPAAPSGTLGIQGRCV